MRWKNSCYVHELHVTKRLETQACLCHADFYSVLGLCSLFPATLLAESCVLLKHMGKYHIVCENQRGTSLKICNLDSIPGLATDSC